MQISGNKKKSRAKNGIPRPKNSFMVYRQEKQEEIISMNGRVNNTVISEIAGYMWRKEDESVKKTYRDKAEIGKREHRLMYPDYKYTPKKPQKQKKQKKQKLDMSKLDLHKNLKTDYFDQIIKYIDMPEIRGTSIQANIYQLPSTFLDPNTYSSETDNLQSVKDEPFSQYWPHESLLQFMPIDNLQYILPTYPYNMIPYQMPYLANNLYVQSEAMPNHLCYPNTIFHNTTLP